MSEHRLNRLLLGIGQLPAKADLQRRAVTAPVLEVQRDSIFIEQLCEGAETASGQGNMEWKLLDTADHPWCQSG